MQQNLFDDQSLFGNQNDATDNGGADWANMGAFSSEP
jgi:hypothetical protein